MKETTITSLLSIFTRRSAHLITCRNPNANAGPLVTATLDLEFASKAPHTLLHGIQPQVTWEGSCCIKSLAIVTHLQDDRLARLVQSQINPTRMSMLDRIVQRLLRNTVEFLLDFVREIWLWTAVPAHEAAPASLADVLQQLSQLHTHVATLQHQLAGLTLELLQERTERPEQRLRTRGSACATDPGVVPGAARGRRGRFSYSLPFS